MLKVNHTDRYTIQVDSPGNVRYEIEGCRLVEALVEHEHGAENTLTLTFKTHDKSKASCRACGRPW